MITFKQYLIERTKPDVQDVQLGFITKSGVRKVKEKKKVEEQFLHIGSHDGVDADTLVNPEAYYDQLHEHHEKAGHYNNVNMASVKVYTGLGHEGLNSKLNGSVYRCHLYPDDSLDRMDRGLSDVLQGSSTPHPMVVYTGVKQNMHDVAAGKSESFHIRHKGYTSTSLHQNIAKWFAQDHNGEYHVLKIHVPQKSRGLYVERHSASEGEHEVLLHKRAMFEVHPKPEIYTEKIHQGKLQRVRFHIWHAKLLHDGIRPTIHAKPYLDRVGKK